MLKDIKHSEKNMLTTTSSYQLADTSDK